MGNQLNGVRLVDEGLRARFKAAYPDVEVQPPSPPRRAPSLDPISSAAQARGPFFAGDSKQPTNRFMDSSTPQAYALEVKPVAIETETAA